MTTLWTPTDAKRRRAILPEGDLKLSDGSNLRYVEPFNPSEWSKGGHWFCRPRKLTVMATIDDTERHGVLLHVSLSHPDRLPDWATIKAVRAAFYPADADVMLVLPREGDYVAGAYPGHDSFVMQMWETPTAWGMR